MNEKKDRVDVAMDWQNSVGVIKKEEVIEQVRVNLLRYLENNQGITRKDIAARCAYSSRTIDNFIQKENTSYRLVMMLVLSFPEIGDGMPGQCPHCNRLPYFPRTK